MQLRYSLLITLLLFVSFVSFAKKTPKYPVANIAEELKKGADAVIRENDVLIEILSEGKMIITEKFVITILKESGLDKANFLEGYDKFSSISDIEATVYDAEGAKIKNIPLSEVVDHCNFSGLYSDSRVKYIDPKCTAYPFTAEYSYKQKINTACYVHGWSGFKGYDTAIESFKFKLAYPHDFPIHYKEQHLMQKGVVGSGTDGVKTLEWSLSNIKAPQYERYSDDKELWVPNVKIAADKFVLDGYEGNYVSWNDYGKFRFNLNKGKDNIPQSTIDEIAKILKDKVTDYERVAAIYKYSQNKNRYISIQEGIGGLQPFDAETVDRLSYGDCKALSNYVVSILNRFGYKALFVLVHAGGQVYEDNDFVNHFSNHAIACVPLENDTIWLECTNEYSPCGYLGDFTDDRNVLLIGEDGGKMVKTPSFSIEENNMSITADFEIDEGGNALAKSTTTYKGSLYGDEYYLVLKDETDRRKKIINSIDIANFDLLDYKLTPHQERKPWLEKDLSLSITGFASKMGDRLFFTINTLNKTTNIPPYSRNRKSPMKIARCYSENDTITYKLPNGYKLEALPKSVELKSEFGEYHCASACVEGVITYKREFKLWQGQYSKEKYNEFVEFLEEIVKHDEAKAVLIKNS